MFGSPPPAAPGSEGYPDLFGSGAAGGPTQPVPVASPGLGGATSLLGSPPLPPTPKAPPPPTTPGYTAMFEVPQPAPSYQPPAVFSPPVTSAPPEQRQRVRFTQQPYFVPLLIGANVIVLLVLALLLYFLLRR